jgi:monofunctional biosynthetic peptidoglycan transglycosylase
VTAPEPTPQITPARPRWGRRVRNVLILALLLAFIVPITDVLAHRFLPPEGAVLAVERVFQGQGYRRDWRSLHRISPNLVYAVIAAEDEKFCRHHGFDWDGIRNAMRYNATHKDRLRGGSTISQQAAKNAFLWPGRGFIRKGVEAYYTVLVEHLWGKPRIMEVYLNLAEWAPGVYGAQAASQYWFHTDADRLTPQQAARLAAILPRPLKWKAAAPQRYVRGRSKRIAPEERTVRTDDLAGCVMMRR